MNTITTPLISIITPVYNGADYIKFLIDSVMNSGFSDYEHIVIDDGSKDAGKTVKALQNYPHLRWWSRENLGQYPTMNEGLEAAIGRFICFISADDIMLPGAMSVVSDVLQQYPDIDGIYGDYGFINPEGVPLKYRRPFKDRRKELYPYLIQISHSSFYLNRDFLLQNDLVFNQELRFVGDYDWIIRILKTSNNIISVPQKLSMIRVHRQQTSTVSRVKMRQEEYHVQKEHNVKTWLTSLFRKYMFFEGLIKTYKLEGLKSTVGIVLERIRLLFSKS